MPEELMLGKHFVTTKKQCPTCGSQSELRVYFDTTGYVPMVEYRDCDCGHVYIFTDGVCFERRPGTEGYVWTDDKGKGMFLSLAETNAKIENFFSGLREALYGRNS
jgi:uncharacterized OB-fold protein